jgi:L-lactate dehydrogenase complex protein LldG
MSSRHIILASVRNNLPRPAVPLPENLKIDQKETGSGRGCKQHLTNLPEVRRSWHEGESILTYFRRELEAMGGKSFEVADATAAKAKVAELFPTAKVICSTVPEVPGTKNIEAALNPHDLNDVDVGVVRSRIGVAEAGAVWLTEADLVVNALGVLSQHLVVLLDPAAIVDTLHDAYEQVDLTASSYGVFMAGPSATGDIEGVIIHGAQGARSMTVLLLAPKRFDG